MDKNGYFVISLDFELLWGMEDLKISEKYKENVLGGRLAIPKILNLFDKYDVHATWAALGIMLNNSKKDILENKPTKLPSYNNPKCSAYNHMNEIGDSEKDDPCHFAGSLIEMIINRPNQEIGCHTYSHYYCLEDGADIDSFKEDIKKSKKIMLEKYGIDVKSIVFPRNQYTNENIKIVEENGFVAFRGNQPFGYNNNVKGLKNIIQRATRFLDSFIPIYGSMTYKIDATQGISNAPGSRFFRPYSNIKLLEKLKIKRIKKQMLHAAKNNEMFHLWWHPHNFGKYTNEMLLELESILIYYSELNKNYGFKSVSMAEYVKICK